MFPITHIWFSRKVLGYMNHLTVLGAVFPDTVVKGCLTRDQTHNVGWGLHKYIEEHSGAYLDFARALVTHTVDPRGLDYYGDEYYGDGYKGYCFQKGAEIEKEVIAACNIPESFGLWKAHNFIEMGIEMNIACSDRELLDAFHEGLNDYRLEKELSILLDDYYGLKAMSAGECFRRFSSFMELKDISSLTFAGRYNCQMQAKHGISINIPEAAKIIEKSRVIVQEDFEAFIEYCTGKVKTMLEEGYS